MSVLKVKFFTGIEKYFFPISLAIKSIPTYMEKDKYGN